MSFYSKSYVYILFVFELLGIFKNQNRMSKNKFF